MDYYNSNQKHIKPFLWPGGRSGIVFFVIPWYNPHGICDKGKGMRFSLKLIYFRFKDLRREGEDE